ncbi:STAS-like domain-containing protein [Flavobacterium sp.]|uniref:STAS-like domain-containing protein n=1 Tax=Flavobacterium sp. TaxID=239 RepID=UPI0039E27C5E
MDTTVFFGKIGSSLGTRDLGAEVRVSIIDKIETNDKVYLDFEGVDIVTNSFADECFSKLRQHVNDEIFKKKVAFLNTNDFVQRVIISAL